MNVTYIMFGVIVAIGIWLALLLRKQSMLAKGNYERHQREKYMKWSRFYERNVFTRKSYRKLMSMMSTIQAYGTARLRELTVKKYTRTMIVSIAIPIVGFIFTKAITAFMVLIVISYVYYQSSVSKYVDDAQVEVLSQMSIVISSFRERYLETKSIPLALSKCDVPSVLKIPIEKIGRILSSTDSLARLEEFSMGYPIRIVNTFGYICYITMEHGDTVNPETKQSSFVENLQVLRQECDNKVKNSVEQKQAFKFLQEICLASLLVYAAGVMYAKYAIPGASALVDSVAGQIITMGMIIIVGFSYYMVVNYTKSSVVNENDTGTFITSLLNKYPKFRKVVENFIPKKYDQLKKVKKLLAESLSSKNLKYLYAQKLLTALGVFVMSFIILSLSTIVARKNIYNNYSAMNITESTNLTVDQVNARKKIDPPFLAMTDEEFEAMPDKTKIQMIRSHMGTVDEGKAMSEIERIAQKRDYYNAAQFDFRIAILSVLFGVVGWNLPTFILKQRKKMVAYETVEDISQLQTMCCVIQKTYMSVWEVLFWLGKQSQLHSYLLRCAYNSFHSDPERALDTLVASSPSLDFKRIVRKLKSAVYELSIRDAFSDMHHEKQTSLVMNELKQREILQSRAGKAKAIYMFCFISSIVASQVIPIGILAANKFKDAFTGLPAM